MFGIEQRQFLLAVFLENLEPLALSVQVRLVLTEIAPGKRSGEAALARCYASIRSAPIGDVRAISASQRAADTDSPADTDSLSAGTILGGTYRVVHELSRGAMGVVYKGHHAMLQRPAAIKLLDPHRTNEQSIKRFEQEVQLTSQLNHPNTIAIYDYGRTVEGAFYYVMEYLDGVTLDNLVNDVGPLPAGRVVFILQQLCGALSEAHECGLVHTASGQQMAVCTEPGGRLLACGQSR